MDPEDDRDWAVYLRRVDDELYAFGGRLDRRGPVLRREMSRGAGVELHHAPSRLRAFGPGELGDAVEFIEPHCQPDRVLQAFVDKFQVRVAPDLVRLGGCFVYGLGSRWG